MRVSLQPKVGCLVALMTLLRSLVIISSLLSCLNTLDVPHTMANLHSPCMMLVHVGLQTGTYAQFCNATA